MKADLFMLDTSIWLVVLPMGRGSSSLRQRVDALLSADLVATTGMVRLELLGGVRSQKEWDRLGELFSALHPLPIGEVTIRSGAILVHRDRHFDLIASHLPLQVESYVTA